MTRAGETMFQLMAYMLVLGLLLEIGNETVVLLRTDHNEDSASLALDRACDRLRRDLAAGAATSGQALIAGGTPWELRDGHLARAGLAQVAIRSVDWRQDGDAWVATIAPRHGAVRTVRVIATVRR